MAFMKRLRATLFPRQSRQDFEDEARFHFDELVDRYVADGMTPADAQRLAARRLGNMPLLRDRTGDADTYRWLSDAVQDLRFAVRTLATHRAFTVVAVLTLALGIGANTAMFSLFDAILLTKLPVHDPSRLVLFTDRPGEGTSSDDPPPTGRWELFSTDVYRHLRDQSLGFESLTAVRSGEAPVLVRRPSQATGTAPLRAQVHLVAGNFFSTLGVDAAQGRTLTPADDVPNAPPVAVISNLFWRTHLQSDRSIVGSTVILNQLSFTVVGIAPPDFFGERIRRPPDFWVPLVFQPQIELRQSYLEARDYYWLNLIGRLAPTVSAPSAQTAATTALQRYLTDQAGTNLTADRRRGISRSYIELADGARGVFGLRTLYSEPLHILLAVVGLVLLLACANVANLLLTRGTARRGEMAIRVALGAGRFRLVRQLLTESLLLAGLGAVCGVLVARWATQALLGLIVSSTAPVHASLDLPVLAFTAGATVAAGILFGLVPALQASRFDLASSIKARQTGGGGGTAHGRASKALVAVQIALSLVLLVGSLLLARSLVNLEGQPLGFDQNHVLLQPISPRLARYTPAAATALYLRVYDRLRALPGVRSATFARYSPFSGSESTSTVVVEGYTARPNEDMDVEVFQVGPDYPETMGMRLLRGRSLTDKDTAGAPLVGLVNEAFVRRYFPTSNPVGRHVGYESAKPDVEIVGVVADAILHDPRKTAEPVVYSAMLQEASGFALDCEFAVRIDGDPAGAASEVRTTLASIAPDVPLNDPIVLATQVGHIFNSERLAARFVIFFGLLALTLACVGIYGTIAQSVAQRTAEIGIRMALGAARPAVLWLILRQTAVLLAIGLVIGVPFAILSGRLVGAQLFGVHPIDPASLGGAAAALVVAALLASVVPARRATRIDAVQALRGE